MRQDFSMLTRIRVNELEVEQFTANLHRICGGFEVHPTEVRRRMRGNVQLVRCAGNEGAHVSQEVQQVGRTPQAIQQDASENYFLILQEEGRALMSQNKVSTQLRPGDMILIDSACPSDFTFYGDYARQFLA